MHASTTDGDQSACTFDETSRELCESQGSKWFKETRKVAGGTIQTATTVGQCKKPRKSSIDLVDKPSKVVDRWTEVQAPMMEPVTKENVLDSTAADALLPVKQKEEFNRIEPILLKSRRQIEAGQEIDSD